jgi:hypothetical protein
MNNAGKFINTSIRVVSSITGGDHQAITAASLKKITPSRQRQRWLKGYIVVGNALAYADDTTEVVVSISMLLLSEYLEISSKHWGVEGISSQQ